MMLKEFAYVLGSYLGDGCYRIRKGTYGEKGEIVFYTRGEKLASALLKLGYKPYPRRQLGKFTGIVVYSIDLARKLREMSFKTGALKKDIPPFIFNLPDELKMSFIEGYLDTDGYNLMAANRYGEKTVREWRFESPNKKLIEQVRYLINSLNLRATKVHSRRRKSRIFNGYKWYEYDKEFHGFSVYPESRKCGSIPLSKSIFGGSA